MKKGYCSVYTEARDARLLYYNEGKWYYHERCLIEYTGKVIHAQNIEEDIEANYNDISKLGVLSSVEESNFENDEDMKKFIEIHLSKVCLRVVERLAVDNYNELLEKHRAWKAITKKPARLSPVFPSLKKSKDYMMDVKSLIKRFDSKDLKMVTVRHTYDLMISKDVEFLMKMLYIIITINPQFDPTKEDGRLLALDMLEVYVRENREDFNEESGMNDEDLMAGKYNKMGDNE